MRAYRVVQTLYCIFFVTEYVARCVTPHAIRKRNQLGTSKQKANGILSPPYDKLWPS